MVATSHLFHEVSLAGLLEIWNELCPLAKHGHAGTAGGRAALSHQHERQEGLGH